MRNNSFKDSEEQKAISSADPRNSKQASRQNENQGVIGKEQALNSVHQQRILGIQ
jgi:hypothetical protein